MVSPRRITLGKGRGAAGRGGAREIAGRDGQWYRPGESLRGRGRGVAGRGGKLQDGKMPGKKKRAAKPPYLWYLEFCKIWKPR